jgi:transaldolase
MKKLEEFKIKIFADGAEKASMVELNGKPFVKGFTTNPTLMRKAGISDYTAFAKEILGVIKDKPISFEVFSDEFEEMERQAQIIASWGKDVYVKIPITNTKGESSAALIGRLAAAGIKLNVTAILTTEQVEETAKVLLPTVPSIVSVFAGRIADTGRDPMPYMIKSKQILAGNPSAELLWASPRELFNIIQAEEMGCDIITVQPDVLKKLSGLGYDLSTFSLDTVKMFYEDGQKAGYWL